MLRSINSPPDPHDDHLRRLLDQRATRADLPGRFSTLSEFSDTPSVYSRPVFSPRPMDGEFHSPQSELRHNIPNNSNMGNRTNRDRLNDPAESILDLDDTRSSTAFSDIYDDDRSPADDDEDDEHMPRMSLLGPKMRFHSRAPWELEDALQEEEEPDQGTLLPLSRKSFGFPGSRVSNASRPSGESTRSQTKSKRSFETTSSHISYPRGALYALAQESLSTSALGSSSQASQKSSRGKFSLNLIRSETPNPSLPSSPISPAHGARSPANTHSFPQSPKQMHDPVFSNNPTYSSPESSPAHRRPSYADNDVHPYANPELVVSYAQDTPLRPHQHIVPHSDSATTVTDSIPLSRSGTKSTLGPDTSVTYVTSKSPTATIHGKDISSPLPALNFTLRPDTLLQTNNNYHSLNSPQGTKHLPGWTDRGTSPTFALISLEEARAQRLRSVTAQSESTVPFPEVNADVERTANFHDHTSAHVVTSRGRARSVSAGAKAKNAIQTIVGGGGNQSRLERQEVDHPTTVSTVGASGKPLKHKKSGFMRLFNGGRVLEKEEKVAPPPVPPLSDIYAAYNPPQSIQKVPKQAIHRIPAPQLSPPFHEAWLHQGEDVSSLPGAAAARPSHSLKRVLPPLSIDTIPQNQIQPHKGPASAVGDLSFQTRALPSSGSDKPWNNDSIPQSAPADAPVFPALKLRPVSTLFSAHFGDHIVAKDSRPSLETDLSTPASSNNVLSPITPDPPARLDSGGEQTIAASITEDQASVVRALQDQMVSAKLAWQRHIWELEGEIRDLKTEVEDLRSGSQGEYCTSCGRGAVREIAEGRNADEPEDGKSSSVMHRPRARTGTSSRFGSAVS